MLPPYHFYWFRIDIKHMTESWFDEALMDSEYRSADVKSTHLLIRSDSFYFILKNAPIQIEIRQNLSMIKIANFILQSNKGRTKHSKSLASLLNNFIFSQIIPLNQPNKPRWSQYVRVYISRIAIPPDRFTGRFKEKAPWEQIDKDGRLKICIWQYQSERWK